MCDKMENCGLRLLHFFSSIFLIFNSENVYRFSNFIGVWRVFFLLLFAVRVSYVFGYLFHRNGTRVLLKINYVSVYI